MNIFLLSISKFAGNNQKKSWKLEHWGYVNKYGKPGSKNARKCDFCLKVFKPKEDNEYVTNHLEKCRLFSEFAIDGKKCGFCNYFFGPYDKLLCHIENQHITEIKKETSGSNNNNITSTQSDEDESFKLVARKRVVVMCQYCNISFIADAHQKHQEKCQQLHPFVIHNSKNSSIVKCKFCRLAEDHVGHLFTHLEESHPDLIQRFEEKIQQCEDTNEIICLICDQRVETKTKAYEHMNEDHPSYLSYLNKMETSLQENETIIVDDFFDVEGPELSTGQEMAYKILNTIELNKPENTIMNEQEKVQEYAKEENLDDPLKEEEILP